VGRALAKGAVEVDQERLLPPRRFQVLPRRWVVERTFSWIDHNRRMSLGTKRGSPRRAMRSSTSL
jgi:transposase